MSCHPNLSAKERAEETSTAPLTADQLRLIMREGCGCSPELDDELLKIQLEQIEQIESERNLTVQLTTWEFWFPYFPAGRVFYLDHPPLRDVSKVEYYDEDEQLTELVDSEYAVISHPSSHRHRGYLLANQGADNQPYWPAVTARPDAVKVTLTAGYDAGQIEKRLLNAIGLACTHAYRIGRDPYIIGPEPKTMPRSLVRLLRLLGPTTTAGAA